MPFSLSSSQEEVSEVPFGGLILNKQEVELALRRAQAAVLNPHIDAKQLLGMSAEQLQKGIKSDKKPLAFSRNVVCVDLEGPDLTDLAFIDLPGVSISFSCLMRKRETLTRSPALR